jgi:aspartyl-tRNA(Asn)/glutamyl-tRNA(Gln) amidotransferase subunit B
MANWTMTEILRLVREEKLDRALVIREWPVSAQQLAGLIGLVQQGTVNRNTAKGLVPKLRGTTQDPAALVAAEGLSQVSDRGALEAAVRDVVAKNAAQVAQFRSGKTQVLGFLVGQVMKATGGKANPQVVQQLLRQALA